jgi:hypothetical protein
MFTYIPAVQTTPSDEQKDPTPIATMPKKRKGAR